MDSLNAVVIGRIDVSPGTFILQVAPDGRSLPDFTPGQFAVLGLPGSSIRSELSDREENAPEPDRLIKRAYSIASSSKEKSYLEFYITMVRSGALTPRLACLKSGSRLFLSERFAGLFTLGDVAPDNDLVLIATGTGLAPYMSMLRTELNCAKRKVAVIHGARHSWDLGYRAELATMQRLCPDFTYMPVVSRPEEEPVPWGGLTGYVQDVWKKGAIGKAWGRAPGPGTTHVFLCGFPGMIEDMCALLFKEGFKEQTKKEKGEVHVERYW